MEALNEASIRTLRSLFGDDDETIGEIFGGLFHSHISKGVKAEVHLTVFIVDKYVHEVYQLQPARASSSTISLGPAPVAVIDVRGNEAAFWVQDGGGLRSGRVWEVQHLLRYSERLVAEKQAPAYLTADRLKESLRPGPHRPQSDEGSPEASYLSFTEDHGDEAGPSTSTDNPYELANSPPPRAPDTVLIPQRKEKKGMFTDTVLIPQRKEKKGMFNKFKGFLKSCGTTKKDGQKNVERARSALNDDEDVVPDSPRPLLTSPTRRKRRSSDDDGDDEADIEPKRQRREREEDRADANNDLRAAQDARDESMINVTDDQDMAARNAVAVLPVATTTVVTQAPTAIVTQAPTAIVTQAPITTADAAVTARPSTRSVGVGTAQAPGATGPVQAPGALGPAQAPGVVVGAAHNAAVVSEDVQLPSKDDIRRTIKELPETAFKEHLKDVREKCEAAVYSKKMSAVALTSSKKRDIVGIIKTHALLAYHPMSAEEYNAIAYEINKMIDRLTRLVELGQRLNRCMKRKIDAAGRRKVAFGGRMEQRYDEFKAYCDRMGRAMARLTATMNQY